MLAIPLAAGVLAPGNHAAADGGSAADEHISTIVVALNAQPLRRLDLRPGAQA
jgi:P-type Cu2+ transporter